VSSFVRTSLALLAALSLLVPLALVVSCSHTPGGEKELLSAADNLRLASIYESRGDIDLALRHFAMSIEADKANPEAYFAMANLNLRIGRYDRAEAAYKKAIRLEPSHAPFYNNLGWLYMETGRLVKAGAMAMEAIERDRAGSYVYLDTLAVIQTKGGKYPEAEKSLNEALELTPPGDKGSRGIIYGHLLDLYEKSGEAEKAEGVQERIEALRK
jgi:Tfp pilus assembly protein PilF